MTNLYMGNLVRSLPITAHCHILTHYRYIAVKNIVRKGEIACNKQFFLFSQCFLPYMVLIFHFKCMLSAFCRNLDQSKILSCGNGLNGRILSVEGWKAWKTEVRSIVSLSKMFTKAINIELLTLNHKTQTFNDYEIEGF